MSGVVSIVRESAVETRETIPVLLLCFAVIVCVPAERSCVGMIWAVPAVLPTVLPIHVAEPIAVFVS